MFLSVQIYLEFDKMTRLETGQGMLSLPLSAYVVAWSRLLSFLFFRPSLRMLLKELTKRGNLQYLLAIIRTCFSLLFENFFETHLQEVFSSLNLETVNTYLLTKGRSVSPSMCNRLWHRICMLNLAHLMWFRSNGSCVVVAFHLSLVNIRVRCCGGGTTIVTYTYFLFEQGDSCTWDQLVSSVPTIIRFLELQWTKVHYYQMDSEMSKDSSISRHGASCSSHGNYAIVWKDHLEIRNFDRPSSPWSWSYLYIRRFFNTICCLYFRTNGPNIWYRSSRFFNSLSVFNNSHTTFLICFSWRTEKRKTHTELHFTELNHWLK